MPFEILESAFTAENSIPAEQRKYFTYLFTQIKNSPLNGKKIHVNWHITDATLLIIGALVKAGGVVTVSAVDGLVSQPDVIATLKEAGIRYFGTTTEIEAYYDKKNPCHIYFDCGAKLLHNPHLKPIEFTVELTHTDPLLYANISHPVINVDDSITKLIETKFGTGNAYLETLKYFLNVDKKTLSKETYAVFGYGKVGSGIVNALVAAGVPHENILVVDPDKSACNRAKFNGISAMQLTQENLADIKSMLKSKRFGVSATGKPGSLGKWFTPDDFIDIKLANMSTEDDFGDAFSPQLFVGKRKEIFNFARKFPTDVRFLEAIFILAFKAAERASRGPNLPNKLNKVSLIDDKDVVKEYQRVYQFPFMGKIDLTDIKLIPPAFFQAMVNSEKKVGAPRPATCESPFNVQGRKNLKNTEERKLRSVQSIGNFKAKAPADMTILKPTPKREPLVSPMFLSNSPKSERTLKTRAVSFGVANPVQPRIWQSPIARRNVSGSQSDERLFRSRSASPGIKSVS